MGSDMQTGSRLAGIFYGLISSAAYGLIPLFTLPLLHAGVTVQTALVYRFGIASIVMWGILRFKGENLAVHHDDLFKIFFLSLMYLGAVFLFFQSFIYLPSGVVATIQFLFPVMVMLIMIVFFHERFQWHTGAALALAVVGVALLSTDPGESSLAVAGGTNVFLGVTISLLAGLCNALYFVGLQVARLPRVNSLVLTLYVMVFCSVISLVYALLFDSLHWIGEPKNIGIATLLALVTAVFSNLTLILAIKRVGSTLASILGVMEPVTAVSVGICVFNEPFTWLLASGVIIIASSVALVVLGGKRNTH